MERAGLGWFGNEEMLTFAEIGMKVKYFHLVLYCKRLHTFTMGKAHTVCQPSFPLGAKPFQSFSLI